ncbi:MAG: hemerythrin domain-containing protein [Deltaproteobacteria bacterium]|nr:hemerythrin domain-containing protein [Deltaproteobacteria bacterium]
MGMLADMFAGHHKECDDLFAAAEAAAQDGAWDKAAPLWERYAAAMERHLSTEEGVLFPAFEDASGMRGGPTQVMRMEHTQMRGLLQQAGQAVAARDADGFGGACETLNILMQQHNMKEENILYPMCDRAVGSNAALVQQLREKLGK